MPFSLDLAAKARSLAGLTGYITGLAACPDGTPVTAEFVAGRSSPWFMTGSRVTWQLIGVAGSAPVLEYSPVAVGQPGPSWAWR